MFLLMFRHGLLLRISDVEYWASNKFCGHVLLFHGGYTNINFLGFIVILIAVGIISAVSHRSRIGRSFERLRVDFANGSGRCRHYRPLSSYQNGNRLSWRSAFTDLSYSTSGVLESTEG